MEKAFKYEYNLKNLIKIENLIIIQTRNCFQFLICNIRHTAAQLAQLLLLEGYNTSSKIFLMYKRGIYSF